MLAQDRRVQARRHCILQVQPGWNSVLELRLAGFVLEEQEDFEPEAVMRQAQQIGARPAAEAQSAPPDWLGLQRADPDLAPAWRRVRTLMNADRPDAVGSYVR